MRCIHLKEGGMKGVSEYDGISEENMIIKYERGKEYGKDQVNRVTK